MDSDTSLKQIIQNMANNGRLPVTIQQGIVKSANPLKMTLVNDAKMTLSSLDLIVPGRLSLKKGDKVHLLIVNNGKIFYVLDKV